MANKRAQSLDVVSWEDAFSDFLLSIAGRAPQTRRFYSCQVGRLVQWVAEKAIPLEEFKARNFRAYMAYRASVVSVRTTLHDANCCRVFFRFCLRNRHIPADPFADYEIPRPPEANVKTPDADQLHRFLRAIERRWDPATNPAIRHQPSALRRFIRTRDYAISALLIETGCRIGDACNLEFADYDPKGMMVTFRATKTRTTKYAPITEDLVKAVEPWLKERKRVEMNREGDIALGKQPRCEPLFFITKQGLRIEPTSFAKAWRKYLDFANLERFGRHGVRHYTLSAMYRKNARSAQILGDHKDPKTTAIYDTGKAEAIRGDHKEVAPLAAVLKNKRSAQAKPNRPNVF